MCALLRASSAAAAQLSRDMTEVPRPVAPATPASAAAPLQRRRLRPPSEASGVSLVRSSLFFIASNSVIGYGGYCFSWLSGALWLAPRDYSVHLHHRNFLRVAGCVMTTALATALHDQRRALVVFEIGQQTIQSVVTFHGVDVPIRRDCLAVAFDVAETAADAGFIRTFEP